ncbi:MAG: hypothetical protein A2751_01720 [Candidatus Doudnabacteria bacterium RIFCSPHIGHO2_01_FULL_46_14]|uniref:Uncharacterized protein n=1 Tax=Candidatus Doudnabacteria bacterium RIFCSPHIGHO2_01_FULL_46_14 TaxID=1817824 RepID=A0A1F5NJN9_9BACT|nr:MAG: hypothetical protein A2751_01720 [Candidatus Doudnabacteria bacterium RIFCSPHIGHO2_01_FULL_46_14]
MKKIKIPTPVVVRKGEPQGTKKIAPPPSSNGTSAQAAVTANPVKTIPPDPQPQSRVIEVEETRTVDRIKIRETSTPPPAPEFSEVPTGGGIWKYVAGVIFAVIVVAILAAVFHNISTENRSFRSELKQLMFTRDILTGKSDPIPDLFTPEQIARYNPGQGDGFDAKFVINNDPRKNFGTTEEIFTLPIWDRKNEEERRTQVATAHGNFLKWVSEKYLIALSFKESVEIGLDDTEGVSESLAEFVRRNLELEEVKEKLIESKNDTRLAFFRISDSNALTFRRFEIKAGDEDTVNQVWEDGLTWLLESEEARSRKDESSIATGLFNFLKRNNEIRKRKIIIFSDGMENSRLETTTFYPVTQTARIVTETNWPKLDEQIQKVQEFPDLTRAQVKWFMPPLRAVFYNNVKAYWQHVLEQACDCDGAPQVEVIR